MDFTRDPIIETVITPKEGCKLVVRSSKSVGQEEYFVDAVEVVTFGSAIFFRSTERPKPFIVPASDYEVLEVREARIVLKNVGHDKSIKIAGGREGHAKPPREVIEEKVEAPTVSPSQPAEADRGDKKRDRRRQSRRRRGRDEVPSELEGSKVVTEEGVSLPLQPSTPQVAPSGPLPASLLAPPPLISETISRYKEQFKDAFYVKEEQETTPPREQIPSVEGEMHFEQPAFGSFDISEENEEEIYRERRRYTAEEEPLSSAAETEERILPDKQEET